MQKEKVKLKHRPFQLPVRTVLFYWFFGLLWIVFSDRILGAIVKDLETYQLLQTYKGQFFIAVTGFLLYPLIAPGYYKTQELTEELSKRNQELEARVASENAQEKRIYQLAYLDKLTQIGNGAKLELHLFSSTRNNNPFALVGIHLTDWQKISTLYGHRFCDVYVLRISQILEQYWGHSRIFRWQRDTFVVTLPLDAFEKVDSQLQSFLATLPDKLQVLDLDVHFRCAIGVVQFPDQGRSEAELLHHLLLAINSGITRGNRHIVHYSEQLKSEANWEQTMEAQIEKALEDDELTLYFQPIVDGASCKIALVEVLLRWFSPMYPQEGIGTLIGIAEKTGLISKIDRWVVESVCKTMHQNPSCFKDLKVSINLSAQSFNTTDLPEFLKACTIKYNIDPSRLVLELTEHSIIDNPQQSLAMMTAIKSQGFDIALDDFGTKYSSLNYLGTMPFDTLKIDKSYVDSLGTDEKRGIIVRQIIQLARDLGLNIIAEGVEFEVQATMLREMGCHYLQGYLFYKPMPLAQLYEDKGET